MVGWREKHVGNMTRAPVVDNDKSQSSSASSSSRTLMSARCWIPLVTVNDFSHRSFTGHALNESRDLELHWVSSPAHCFQQSQWYVTLADGWTADEFVVIASSSHMNYRQDESTTTRPITITAAVAAAAATTTTTTTTISTLSSSSTTTTT